MPIAYSCQEKTPQMTRMAIASYSNADANLQAAVKYFLITLRYRLSPDRQVLLLFNRLMILLAKVAETGHRRQLLSVFCQND